MKDYQTSFSIALENFPPISSNRVTFIPGAGMQIDPKIEYTDQEAYVDNIRTALRSQLAAHKDPQLSAFSNMLVEQVESDFHSAVKAKSRIIVNSTAGVCAAKPILTNQ